MQSLGDTFGRGFEPIERGVSAGSELPLTGLAEEILNRLMATMVAIADQGVDGRVRVPEVVAIRMRTSVTLGVEPFLAAAGAFALGVRDHGFRAGQ
jgi:hypothetical protein